MSSVLLVSLAAFAQSPVPLSPAPDSTKKVLTAEAACGQCMFGMKEKGCTLAIRVDGKAWFVEGTSIDDHGDAHAENGFCNAIRKALVQGAPVNNRFRVTYFKLQPVQKAVTENKQE